MEGNVHCDKAGPGGTQVPLGHCQLLWNPVSIETQGRSWNYRECCEAMEPRINSDTEASWNTRDTEILPGLVEPRHHCGRTGPHGIRENTVKQWNPMEASVHSDTSSWNPCSTGTVARSVPAGFYCDKEHLHDTQECCNPLPKMY